MPIVYDLETDIRFLQGKEQGIDKGILIEKRKAVEGMIVSNLLTFEQIMVILGVSMDFVKMIAYELEKEEK